MSRQRSIERHGGKPFWFHAMRNCFISVASRGLLLPESLVKRMVNHRRPAGDVTQDYAAAEIKSPSAREGLCIEGDALATQGGRFGFFRIS